jgi:hypothetical protein
MTVTADGWTGGLPGGWGSRLGAPGRSEQRSTALDWAVLLGSSRPDLRCLVFVLVTASLDGR